MQAANLYEGIPRELSEELVEVLGQVHDLEFILHYQEDLNVVPKMSHTGAIIDAANT